MGSLAINENKELTQLKLNVPVKFSPVREEESEGSSIRKRSMPISMSDNSPTITRIAETPTLTPTFIHEDTVHREVSAHNSERMVDQRQDCAITDMSKESFNNRSPIIPLDFAK